MWDGTIAVLADPHLHDTGAGRAFGLDQDQCFRTLADTIHSTRVFNESEPALRGMLDQIEACGIAIVVIAGDMTDDGQAPNWARARALLREYEDRAGMRFFLTPGNHDQWVQGGLDQAKSVVMADGSHRELSSKTNAPAMRRLSQEEVIGFARGFGYCRHPRDLLWETPFGMSDSLADRAGSVLGPDGKAHLVPDLSYLAEPVEGLWILSLDASVYLPEGDGWRDYSSEGWLAVLRHKAWLLDWMRDVAARAVRGGKRLVTFSHYPVVDVLNGLATGPGAPVAMGGERRVMPDAACSERIAETGIGLHFSGHWHMNRTGIHRGTHAPLVNVAVPSPVGYPAAWKQVRLKGATARIRTRRVVACPGFDAAFGIYRGEGDAQLGAAADHDAFLRAHLGALVERRYLPRDWPPGFVEALQTETLAGLAARLGLHDLPPGAEIGGMAAMQDLYAIERGGQLSDVPEARLDLYRALPQTPAPRSGDALDHAVWRLLEGLGRHARGEDDDSFEVPLGQPVPRVSAGAD